VAHNGVSVEEAAEPQSAGSSGSDGLRRYSLEDIAAPSWPVTCTTCGLHSARARVIHDYPAEIGVEPRASGPSWQSLWQSGRCHRTARDATDRTMNLTRPAALLQVTTR